MPTTDVATKAISSNPILNGDIVTQPTGANAANFKDKNVDTGPTDVRGPAPAETDLETDYTNYFDDPRYYSGDAVT